jgi:hypothetical protein
VDDRFADRDPHGIEEPMTGGRETEAALDAATAALRASPAERDAVRRYQSVRGTYAEINALLRGADADPATARRHLATVRTLDGLLARASLPCDVVVYRGLTELPALVPPDATLPRTRLHLGYMSTSPSRRVAVEGFADADLARGGLLRIVARAGTPALWVPPLGDPGLAHEREVLFSRGTSLTFWSWRVEDRTVEVDCEVTG